MVRETLTLAALTGLLGCAAAERPAAVACERPTIAGAAAGADPVAAVAAAVEAVSGPAAAARAAAAGQQFLVLSTGGQWGAFGAGFLAGWSGNPAEPRPDFDLVTGVSAGALLAVPAALGPTADPVLARFRGIGNDDLVQSRGLGALYGPSLYAVDGLERLVRSALDAPAVAALAALADAGRRVLVGAVELETGDLRVFDLTETARSGDVACLGEALLASAAIPALFPPRDIDGRLHADGGIRAHVFLDGLAAGAERVRARDGAFAGTLTIVVNGDLRVTEREVAYRTLDVAARSAEIVFDEGLRTSIRSLLRLAEGSGWTIRGVTARGVDLSPCAPYETPFDACVTRTLYDHGLALARAEPIAWLSAEQLAQVVGER